MAIDRPPFRADHVGSLLRTAPIKAARERQIAGEISAEEITAIQDAEIVKIIAKQEEAGLKLVTDGELRRRYWSYDYLWELEGVGYETRDSGVRFAGVTTKGDGIKVEAKIQHRENHPMLGHFRFLAAHTAVTAKMTIPSPSVLHWRLGAGALAEVYPDIDEFFTDLGEAYRRSLRTSTTQAAAISSSMTPCGPIFALRRSAPPAANAVTIPTSCRSGMPAALPRPSVAAPKT